MLERIAMKINLTTGPVGVSWLVSKLVARQQKRQTRADADAIENLSRLHDLMTRGVITEDEFAEMKKRLTSQIG